MRPGEKSQSLLHRTLLDLDGGGREGVEDRCRCSARRLLIPCRDGLHEADLDNAHSPLEILGPRLDDWWKRNGRETNDGDGLEVSEEGEGVRGNVGGRIVMTETSNDG